MLCPCRGECNSDGRLDQSAESATAPRFRKDGIGGGRGHKKRSGDAASLGLTIGGVEGRVKRGAQESKLHGVFLAHAESGFRGVGKILCPMRGFVSDALARGKGARTLIDG
jgi:hypothetical protein